MLWLWRCDGKAPLRAPTAEAVALPMRRGGWGRCVWMPALSHRLGFEGGGSVLLTWTLQIQLDSASCEVQLPCPAAASGFATAQGWTLLPTPAPSHPHRTPPQCGKGQPLLCLLEKPSPSQEGEACRVGVGGAEGKAPPPHSVLPVVHLCLSTKQHRLAFSRRLQVCLRE